MAGAQHAAELTPPRCVDPSGQICPSPPPTLAPNAAAEDPLLSRNSSPPLRTSPSPATAETRTHRGPPLPSSREEREIGWPWQRLDPRQEEETDANAMELLCCSSRSDPSRQADARLGHKPTISQAAKTSSAMDQRSQYPSPPCPAPSPSQRWSSYAWIQGSHLLVMEKLLLGEEDDDARGCSDHASADAMEDLDDMIYPACTLTS